MKRKEASTLPTHLLSVLIFLFITEIQGRKLEELCSSSCGDIKNISYPFRLMGDPVGCGDPDFELSCQNNKTILQLYSGQYYVKNISYDDQVITVVDVNLANGSCSLPNKYLRQNIFRNIFNFDNGFQGFQVADRYTYANYINCSGNVRDSNYQRVPCLSTNQSQIYVNYGGRSLSDLPDLCSFITVVPILITGVQFSSYEAIMKLLESGFELHWSVECRNCVDAGSFCFLNLDTLTCPESTYSYLSRNVYFIVTASLFDLAVVLYLIARFLIAPLVLFAFLIHKFKSTRKTVDNVEKFLHKQQSWMPKRYSYSELMAVTNNFRDKLGQGGFGSVYKGQLHTGSLIAVKLLENTKFSGEEFINEVSTIGRIHHVNVVQLVGFCSDGSKRALVYEFMPNGSLDRYIFLKESKGQVFSWEKLHEIASGIARGIEYLHGGCDVCILHFDIKPHNILLDEFFIPKVSDFGLAKFYPKENDFVSVSTTRGTIGYIAPELVSRNFGAVSCKSDVYSFGMLLLEMVGGRRNSIMKATHSSRAYFPSWVYDRIIKGEDLELPNVSEIEHLIAKKLCIIGLWCIQVRPADRPSMTKVMEMLEGSIDDLLMPPKPFFSSSSSSHRNSGREIQCDHSSTELLDLESDSIVEEYSCYDSNV